MNTTALSGILAHVGAITDPEVSELEKLAESFPYCQTAHTLLAKALHDRGSLLAGPRLRRAATYAPDRRMLRRLLLTPPLAETQPLALPQPSESPFPATAAEAPALAVSAAGQLVPAIEIEAASEIGSANAPAASSAEASAEAVAEIPAPAATEAAPEALIEPELVEAMDAPPAFTLTPAPPVDATVAMKEEVDEPTPDSAPPALLDLDLVPQPEAPALIEPLLFEETSAETIAAASPLLVVDDELSAVLLVSATPPVPALEPDPAVAYHWSTSRYGAELVATNATEFPTEVLTDVPAEALPDARWVEHLALHRPPAAVVARPFAHQFALIDRFLREKPRLRALDPTRPLPDKVPDLASASGRADGTIASESMARILARQGKTARAIAMYEQLQARFPEKAAIFAEQIAGLRAS